MKNSKVLYLLLAFVMCLSLAACGGGGEEITTPAWFEGMVSDSQNKVDINAYGGTWTGDSGSMVVELSESGDKQGDDVGGEDYSALAGEWYQDYDGLVFAAEAQPDNYKDSAKRMQLDSIAPEAAIMDIPTLDPHGNLYFAICG